MDLANNGVRDDMTCADILCMVAMAMTLDNVCWCHVKLVDNRI